MSDLALFLVRAAFVVVLWIFIFTIISVVRSDLFGQKIVRKVVKANSPQVLSTPILPPSAGQPATPSVGFAQPESKLNKNAKPAIVPERLLITAGDKAGYQLKLQNRDITIGRAETSDLVIDDEFASTNHARLFKANGVWMVEDLKSTNGTYLDGEKVTAAVALTLGSEVRIGKTAFELQG